MTRRPLFIALGLAAAAVLALVAYAGWMRIRPPYPVAIGTPIRHDDFLFTVLDVRRQALSGGGASYRVAVNVENQAKVVNYQWRDTIASVRAFDATGFGHDFFPETNGVFIIAPGESRVAHLTFYVPAGMSSANLQFWDGIFMGDALNGAAYAKAVVPLEPYHPPIGT
jgi:hypothetical protein